MKIKEQLQTWQKEVQALECQIEELIKLVGKQTEAIEALLQASKNLTKITQETNQNILALLQQQLGE